MPTTSTAAIRQPPFPLDLARPPPSRCCLLNPHLLTCSSFARLCHAAASVSALAPPDSAPPAGVDVREGCATVRSDTATFEQLQWATAYNKKGTRGTRLSLRFEINQGGDQASVHVVALWAALRQAGGIHLVRAASPLPHCCFPFTNKNSALPPACRRASVLDTAPPPPGCCCMPGCCPVPAGVWAQGVAAGGAAHAWAGELQHQTGPSAAGSHLHLAAACLWLQQGGGAWHPVA